MSNHPSDVWDYQHAIDMDAGHTYDEHELVTCDECGEEYDENDECGCYDD